MSGDDALTAQRDRDHLKVLAICYFVYGGLSALGALFPLIHVTMGILILNGVIPMDGGRGGAGEAKFVGTLFVALGGTLSLLFACNAVIALLAGRALLRRRALMLCQIAAGLACLWIPIGTVLGVFSFIVLARPSVRALFAADQPPR